MPTTSLRSILLALPLVAACGSSGGNNNGSPDASNNQRPDGRAVDGDGSTNPDGSTAIDGRVGTDGSTNPSGFQTIPLTTPDQTFWGPIATVGTQMFMMDLDTGSTTVGVAATGCSTCTGVSPLYAPGSTATNESETTDTTYEDNSGWSGPVFKDKVSLGAGTPVVSMKFGEITKQTQFFPGGNEYQGIFGLGTIANIAPNTDSYMDDVAATEDEIMGFELCDTNGTMWLGGFDETHASAAMAYTPLLAINDQDNPYYSINVNSMSIGTTSVGTGAATFEAPVVDTGTSLFYVPTPVNTAVLKAVNASTGWKALFGTKKLSDSGTGCVQSVAGTTAADIDAQLPALTMTMPNMSGGADLSFTVKPMASYLLDGGNGMFCYAMGDGGTQEATTMGDTIMRAFVTVIDVKNGQVGFAPDKGCNGANTLVVHRPIDVATFHPHLPRPRAPRRFR